MHKCLSFNDFWCSIKNYIVKFLVIIIIVVLLIFLIIMFTTGMKLMKKNNTDQACLNRIPNCMQSFDLIPDYPQKPIPEIYNNIFFNDNAFPHALRDYFYACSYKSYLPCGQTSDVVSYNALAKVLAKGARVINLDLFYTGFDAFDKNTKLIVGNVETVIINSLPIKKLTGLNKICNKYYDKDTCGEQCYLPYLEFDKCLQLIKELAWKQSSAPLFLYLNLEFEPNQGLEYQAFSQINSIFRSKLMDKYYGFQRVPIGSAPYSQAKNKIIIITNRRPVNSFLNEITNSVMSAESIGIKLYTISIDKSYKDVDYYGESAVVSLMSTDKRKVIENTSQNMVAVIKTTMQNQENIYDVKKDIFNYNTDWNFSVGISMTFMNWQVYPDANDYFKKYMEKFKDGCMILKPQELRYIPKPPEDVYKRNKALDFNNIKVYGLNGFMDFQT